MFAFLQVVCVVILLAALVVYFRKILRRPMPLILALCVLVIIAAFVSNAVLDCIPMPTEQIILTATGEKNELALQNEVSLSGIVADGKTYEVENAVEGKWFWQGDHYMWRTEADTRQPAGTTRSITLNIPVGDGRALIFNNNKYRGVVEITYQGTSQKYDLYSESTQDVRIGIPSTNKLYDDLIKIGRLAFFTAVIIVLMGYPLWTAKKYHYNTIKTFFEKHWDKIYYISLATVYVIIIYHNSARGSLWGDEVWQLGWYYTNYTVQNYGLIFLQLSDFWFNIMPYGHQNLLLLSQLFVAGSIYISGLIGYRLKGKHFGVILASVTAFSLTVIYQCAMEIRNYAMMFFCTTLLLYLFICRQQRRNSGVLSILLYSVVAVLTIDTHQFGLLVAGLFLFADLLLIVLRKISSKNWLEFILPMIYFAWWVSVQDFESANHYSWGSPATVSKVFNTVTWLCSNNELLLLIMIGGVVYCAAEILDKVIKKQFDFHHNCIDLMILLTPILVISIIWFYSAKLNPKNPLFMDRYFISCEIFILYLISLGLDVIINFVCRLYEKRKIEIGIVVFLLFSICVFNWSKIGPWEIYPAGDRTSVHDFKSAADYLMAQNDIYCDSTLCIVEGNIYHDSGFEYYLTHKGKKDSINHYSIFDDASNFFDYDTIYVMYARGGYNENFILQNGYVEENSSTAVAVKRYVKIQ